MEIICSFHHRSEKSRHATVTLQNISKIDVLETIILFTSFRKLARNKYFAREQASVQVRVSSVYKVLHDVCSRQGKKLARILTAQFFLVEWSSVLSFGISWNLHANHFRENIPILRANLRAINTLVWNSHNTFICLFHSFVCDRWTRCVYGAQRSLCLQLFIGVIVHTKERVINLFEVYRTSKLNCALLLYERS